MKRFVGLVLALLIILLLPFAVAALGVGGVSMDIDETEYAVLTKDTLKSKTELVESLGYTTESITKYFKDNNLLLFAANADNSRQVQIKSTETEFTRQLGDLDTLDNEQIIEIAKKILPSSVNENYIVIKSGDMYLLEFTLLSSDGQGKFCNRQYVTIRGGKLYSVSFFENGEQLSDDFSAQADSMLQSLNIEGGGITANDAGDITIAVIVWVLIAVAAAVAVWMIVSLVRDAARKNEGEERIVINRRKYRK